MVAFPGKRVIVGSVSEPPYTNYGNRLIVKSTLALLGLDETTPTFSVFRRIDDALLDWINSHDLLVITGCTTLQDGPGHQVCFDDQFLRIRIPKVCFAGAFYCEAGEAPPLRIARLYDNPIGARDPWTADYLMRNGIESYLIGCPTLLDVPEVQSWKADTGGPVLVSSSPELAFDWRELAAGRRAVLLKHDSDSAGEEILDYAAFENASLVITGRLHAALPAVARGIPVRFYGVRHWRQDLQAYSWGGQRHSLLSYLGISLDGKAPGDYPRDQIRRLRQNFSEWLQRIRYS